LGIGDWAQSPIPNPQSPINIIIAQYSNLLLKPQLNIKINYLNFIIYYNIKYNNFYIILKLMADDEYDDYESMHKLGKKNNK